MKKFFNLSLVIRKSIWYNTTYGVNNMQKEQYIASRKQTHSGAGSKEEDQ